MSNPGITCDSNPAKEDAFISLQNLQKLYTNTNYDKNISPTNNAFLKYVNNGECGIKRSVGMEFYNNNKNQIYNIQCAISDETSKDELETKIKAIQDCIELKRTLVVYNGIIMDFNEKYPDSNNQIQPLDINKIINNNGCKLKCSVSGGKKIKSRRGHRVKKARRSRKHRKQHK